MTESKPSNVVLVVMDTAREDATSTIADRPNSSIGRLREEGTTFSNTFASSPWTLPSHASLFTGTYPSEHGAHAGHKRLDGALRTLPEVFGDAGYETVAVTNNAWVTDEFGFGRGFGDLYKVWQYVRTRTDFGEIALTEEGTDRITAALQALFTGELPANVLNAIYGKFLYRRNDYGAKRTNRLVENWLDARTNTDPFFMFVNYLEPHLQYQPPERLAREFLPSGMSYEEATDIPQSPWQYVTGNVHLTDHDLDALRGLYRAEVAYLDERIGELRSVLERAGEFENTLFVLTSDHGENVGDHGLMDHQYSLHDTVTHVPLVCRGGEFSSGETVDELTELVDLFPTLLDAAAIEAADARDQARGRSLVPNATNVDEKDGVVAEYMGPMPSMAELERRFDELSDDVGRYDRRLRAIRTASWKLVVGSDGSTELYELGPDPNESTNVAAEHPETVRTLETRLTERLGAFDEDDTAETVEMRDSTRRHLEDLGYIQ